MVILRRSLQPQLSIPRVYSLLVRFRTAKDELLAQRWTRDTLSDVILFFSDRRLGWTRGGWEVGFVRLKSLGDLDNKQALTWCIEAGQMQKAPWFELIHIL
jgi:hypothetical protein